MRISDWSSDVCSSDLSGLAGRLLGRLANGAHEIAFIVADRQFGADAKQGRKPDALEQLPAMEIDLILEPGITGGIGGGQIVDPDRVAIGQDTAQNGRASCRERVCK